ncbi:MAG: hypothetical protein IT191_01955 [Microbacteriaceae bacterium]|nr:hypothetical protein [Cryobacterium sp.]MCC6375764.1 hypothetical protein [Microbacteriaceae bacterium]
MNSYTPVDENTLGVEIGKKGKPRSKSMTPAARALRKMSAGSASLGTNFLGIGYGIIAGFAGVFCMLLAIIHYPDYPNPVWVIFAWLLYIVSIVSVGIAIFYLGEKMPGWLYIAFLVCILTVVALDFIAIWPLKNLGEFSTASVAASAALMIAVTLRPAWELIASALGLTLIFTVSMFITTPLVETTAPTQLLLLAEVILPTVFSVWFLAQFRRIVQREMDRVLVQSNVLAPRLAVGMLASEELARLDLAAEELFESIASGRTKLPLDPKTASTAASLATELRLHLIEGRRETWLYHAISESELLGRSVTLSDPGSLAGLMTPTERDGLLSAVWLLLTDTAREKATMRLTLGPASSGPLTSGPDTIQVPIEIKTTGIPRSKVDPAIWAAIARVGTFETTAATSNLAVRIDCLVSNPAEQYHADQRKDR